MQDLKLIFAGSSAAVLVALAVSSLRKPGTGPEEPEAWAPRNRRRARDLYKLPRSAALSHLYHAAEAVSPQPGVPAHRVYVCASVPTLPQLDAATHEALHEMFGVAGIEAFEHLGRMTQAGHVVDFAGKEAYLPNLKRLAIPISFIHGAENQCFLPESTRISYELLRKENGTDLYERHVIPGYGHIDCILGKNAAVDVFPYVLDHLETTGKG